MFLALVAGGFALQTVDCSSLLAEMRDLERLLEPASYRYLQASSYDRASLKPGSESWFANDDWGKFIRKENRGGREEFVMMEAEGPGAILRFWSANPSGTLRIYLDGDPVPKIECWFKEFFGDPGSTAISEHCYVSAKGYNFYAPIPYAKSAKVTLSGPEPIDRVYYHVGYRTYEKTTSVRTFDLAKDQNIISKWSELDSAPLTRIPSQTLTVDQSGKNARYSSKSGGLATQLVVRAKKQKGSWRDARLLVKADDVPSIDTTIGDFLGMPAGYKSFKSQVAQVFLMESDDVFEGKESIIILFNLPIPFATSLDLKVTAPEGFEIEAEAFLAKVEKVPSLRLYCETQNFGQGTRPFSDMRLMSAKGKGRYVGSILSVENPVMAWWGEGDEKVVVDNEPFPSLFGTGTEDYFGYAWCWPEEYSKPFHGQPRVDGPGNYGHTTNFRWHTWDDIPFSTSLSFDLEKWHWADTDASFTTTAFWYGEPGYKIRKAELPAVREFLGMKRLPGVLEGEDLRVLKVGSGTAEKQGGFIETSGGEQLWWKDSSVGGELQLGFPVEKPGRFRIEGHLCTARDYGIHEIFVNGKFGNRHDFYSDNLSWKTFDLGIHDLQAGENLLFVRANGHHALAEPRAMFGLDYLKLIPVADPK